MPAKRERVLSVAGGRLHVFHHKATNAFLISHAAFLVPPASHFHETGRGSVAGHDGSHASSYQLAGVNGSWHAFGATYANQGFVPPATFSIHEMLVLPTTAVV